MNNITEEKQDIIKGSLAGMLRELRCPLCLELYEDPVTTTCGHNFCRICIEKQITKHYGECPSCHKPLTLQQLNTCESLKQIVKEFENVRHDFEGASELNLSQESPINIPQEERTADMDIDPPNTESEKQYRILQLNEDSFDEIHMPSVTLESKISGSMTHLVLDADNHDLAEFNQQYCLGVLNGCHIVNQNWLKICVEKNEMIPENRFEIQGDKEHGRTGAPIKARKNRESGKHNLFAEVRVGLIGDTNKKYYKYLVTGRGQVDPEANVLVICSDDAGSIEELKNQHSDKTLLSKTWIDDCIANYEVMKKDDYILK